MRKTWAAPLQPESPWYGYSLGDWTEEWDKMALRATQGKYQKMDCVRLN